MSCYISSNANRLYTALEIDYGQVAAITSANRIAAVKLTAKQSPSRVWKLRRGAIRQGAERFPASPPVCGD